MEEKKWRQEAFHSLMWHAIDVFKFVVFCIWLALITRFLNLNFVQDFIENI